MPEIVSDQPLQEEEKHPFGPKDIIPLLVRHKGTVIFIALIATVAVMYSVTKTLKELREHQIAVNPQFTVNESSQSTNTAKPSNAGWADFVSKLDGFSFKYPPKAYIGYPNPFSNDSPTYKAVYIGPKQKNKSVKEENLTDGYIFKIVVNKIPDNRDLASIVNQKRQSFILSCPSIAKISENIENAFSLSNCPADYKETFLQDGNKVYELAQIVKGDIGYKEAYEKITDEIFSTFKISTVIPNTQPEDPFITYSNKNYGLSFKHPKLDTNCCSAPKPPVGDFATLGTFALPSKQSKAFDGFGLYIEENTQNINFSTYLENQKKALLDDFKLVNGVEAENSKDDLIIINDKEARKLSNYAWWGDVIYIQLPNRPEIVVLSKVDYLSGSFDELFDGIISTFRFSAL